MKKIISVVALSAITFSSHAQDIQIRSLIDAQAINCELFSKRESKLNILLQDFSGDGQKKVNLNKAKQTMTIGKSTYWGVQGYQYYKTARMEQEDFAVNFNVFGMNLIKIAIQSFKSKEGESGSYYLVFKGSPEDVTYYIRKAMGSDWNTENIFEETPQGNSKIMCVYAG